MAGEADADRSVGRAAAPDFRHGNVRPIPRVEFQRHCSAVVEAFHEGIAFDHLAFCRASGRVDDGRITGKIVIAYQSRTIAGMEYVKHVLRGGAN